MINNSKLRSKKAVYKRLQYTLPLRGNSLFLKIKIDEYVKKYTDVPKEILEKFTEIHGLENGYKFKFKSINNSLFFGNIPDRRVCVFYIDGDYICKEKLHVDELYMKVGSKDEIKHLVKLFKLTQSRNFSIVLNCLDAYSDEFIMKHINFKILQKCNIENNIKAIHLVRKIKIKSIL